MRGTSLLVACAATAALTTCVIVPACKETPKESACSASSDLLRQLGRLATSYELARIHSRGLDSEQEPPFPWEELFHDQLVATGVNAVWECRIVDSSQSKGAENAEKSQADDASLTAFEVRAIQGIEKGETEVLDTTRQDVVFYLKPVQVLSSCQVCHPPGPDRPGLLDPISVDGKMFSLQIKLGTRPEPRG